MSRAKWTNPLPWRQDEERGPLIETLDWLTRGTSFYNQTCIWYPDLRRWMICFTYAFNPDWDVWNEWCTWADDPELPPAIGPGPPPPDYPDIFAGMTFQLFPNGGTSLCWMPVPMDALEFFAGLGPWGGWGQWVEGLGVPDMWVEIYAVSWEPGIITWRITYQVTGGGSGSADDTTFGGSGPAVTYPAGSVVDCPGLWLSIITALPPP